MREPNDHPDPRAPAGRDPPPPGADPRSTAPPSASGPHGPPSRGEATGPHVPPAGGEAWSDDDVEALAERFSNGTLPAAAWTHRAHLVVGAWHVHRFGRDESLAQLRTKIRQLNEIHGTPNTPTRGYHETITGAYVRLLSAFLGEFPERAPLGARVSALLASPLAGGDALSAFYSRERLFSTTARAEWLEPDLAPLEPSRLVRAPLPPPRRGAESLAAPRAPARAAHGERPRARVRAVRRARPARPGG